MAAPFATRVSRTGRPGGGRSLGLAFKFPTSFRWWAELPHRRRWTIYLLRAGPNSLELLGRHWIKLRISIKCSHPLTMCFRVLAFVGPSIQASKPAIPFHPIPSIYPSIHLSSGISHPSSRAKSICRSWLLFPFRPETLFICSCHTANPPSFFYPSILPGCIVCFV